MRERAVDALALGVAKAAAMAWVLHCGFVQVSDDDHSRVVIAELFAHAPALDPSGTSWLPFPFWLHGAAMALFGRSLATEHAVAFVLGALTAPLPYLAARHVGVGRAAALLGAALFALTPWVVWLGPAPVPEAWVGALLGAGLLLVGAGRARAALVGAGLLWAATLSRYDGWAAAALAAIVLAVRALRSEKRERAVFAIAALVAAAGPILWMAWNRHAHGSATHFVDRVAAYRRSIGAASAPLPEKLLGYPRALWSAAPELVISFAVFAPFAARVRAVRARWGAPLAGAALSFAFLIYGDVRDGAPTHHPERALVALLAPLAGFAAEGVIAALVVLIARARRVLVGGLGAAALVAWCYFAAGRWSYVPGRDPSERRDAQIARGLELRERGVKKLTIEPCQYEHFALVAAYGAPENVTTLPSSKAPVTGDCPRVREE